MATVQKRDIILTSHIVGQISADGGAVTGAGGPLHPQLVISLAIHMQLQPQPEPMSLAVLWLRAGLSLTDSTLDQSVISANLVCQPTSEVLVNEHSVRSVPNSGREHVVSLRFPMSTAEVEALERQRHALKSDPFTLYVGIEIIVAAVKTAMADNHDCGSYSELRPFDRATVMPVPLQIAQSIWVHKVLPGLGYDRRRLVEIGFPPPLPDHASAASEWDKARQALDERRYGDCVAECRDLFRMWEQQLEANKDHHVADVIAEKRRWGQPADDGRRAFLDGLWKAATDIVNNPHHPEGQPTVQLFDAGDARMVLLLTAALSEYVSR